MKVAKAVIGGFTALGTWGGTALADGKLSPVECFGLCGIPVVVASVWATKNGE